MTVQSIVDPQDRLHSEMLRIWSRLLESSDLSIDDDFFDKGGDSLLATELMLELQQFAGGPLPNSLLFESSTVKKPEVQGDDFWSQELVRRQGLDHFPEKKWRRDDGRHASKIRLVRKMRLSTCKGTSRARSERCRLA